MPCDCSGMELEVIARYSEMLCYCCKNLSYEEICADPRLYMFYKDHLLHDWFRLKHPEYDKSPLTGLTLDEEKVICETEIRRMGLSIKEDASGSVEILEAGDFIY